LEHRELLAARAGPGRRARQRRAAGDEDSCEQIVESVAELDTEIRSLGVRGRLTPVDPLPKPVKRSTRRRQDAPDLPRRPVQKRTMGGPSRSVPALHLPHAEPGLLRAGGRPRRRSRPGPRYGTPAKAFTDPDPANRYRLGNRPVRSWPNPRTSSASGNRCTSRTSSVAPKRLDAHRIPHEVLGQEHRTSCRAQRARHRRGDLHTQRHRSRPRGSPRARVGHPRRPTRRWC
jgi:hypothetical protein